MSARLLGYGCLCAVVVDEDKYVDKVSLETRGSEAKGRLLTSLCDDHGFQY